MAKLKLTLTSTPCWGIYSIVNIFFNGVSIESNLQLSAEPLSKTYDVVHSDVNTLKIDNINNAASGTPPDYTEKRAAIITAMEYAENNADYKVYISQGATQIIVPSGPNAGPLDQTTVINQFNVWELDYELKFDSVGIYSGTGNDVDTIPTDILYRELPSNTYYSFGTNHIYDLNGDIIG